MSFGVKAAEKAGYLEKQGGNNKGYKKRWFVLTSESLVYYKACGDKTPAGEIRVADISLALASEGEHGDKSRFCFDVRTPERLYSLATDSAALRGAWIAAINAQVPPERLAKAKKGFLGGYLKSGWLDKEGGSNKAFQSRWCCLSGRSLDYFKQKGGTVPAGSINISDIERVQIDAKNALTFTVTVPGRVFVFKAESADKTRAWVEEIQPLIGNALPRTAVFGVDLPTAVSRCGVDGVPAVIRDGISYLSKVLETEGILRLSGAATEIADFKKQYDAGIRVNLDETNDPHVVAGLMKTFVRELPEPLLSFNLYEPFMLTRWESDVDTQKRFYRTLVQQLPVSSIKMLEVLLPFLHLVTTYSHVNKMHASNVSVVFGPNILKSKDEDPMTMMQQTPDICVVCAQLIELSSFLFTPIDHIPYIFCARAAYDYVAGQAHEVSLKVGSIVFVTRTELPSSEGWWEGEIGGHRGLFPASYVEILATFKASKRVTVAGSSAPTTSTAAAASVANTAAQSSAQAATTSAGSSSQATTSSAVIPPGGLKAAQKEPAATTYDSDDAVEEEDDRVNLATLDDDDDDDYNSLYGSSGGVNFASLSKSSSKTDLAPPAGSPSGTGSNSTSNNGGQSQPTMTKSPSNPDVRGRRTTTEGGGGGVVPPGGVKTAFGMSQGGSSVAGAGSGGSSASVSAGAEADGGSRAPPRPPQRAATVAAGSNPFHSTTASATSAPSGTGGGGGTGAPPREPPARAPRPTAPAGSVPLPGSATATPTATSTASTTPASSQGGVTGPPSKPGGGSGGGSAGTASVAGGGGAGKAPAPPTTAENDGLTLNDQLMQLTGWLTAETRRSAELEARLAKVEAILKANGLM